MKPFEWRHPAFFEKETKKYEAETNKRQEHSQRCLREPVTQNKCEQYQYQHKT